MKRDKPGNADYSFKDMTECSLLFPCPRVCDDAVIRALISRTFTRLLPSLRS